MYKKAILSIFWTLILFSTSVFAIWEPLLQATNIQNYRVQKIYTNFSTKLNARISAKLTLLSPEAKSTISNLARTIEFDFGKIDLYVATQDRVNGIATVNHINTLVGQIQWLLASAITPPVTPLNSVSLTNSVESTPVNILYYADNFEGLGTSGGNVFSQKYFSSANCSVPLHTMIQVVSTDKSVIVKNNDRPNCQLHPDIVDLSKSAFQSLAPLSRGKIAWGFVSLKDAGKAFTKQYIPTDFFSPLGIALDANIPNAYLLNETFHISGRLIDGKNSSILFFVLPSGKQFDIGEKTTDGHFSYAIPLTEIGKYRLVIASGDGFETTKFFEFQVFDPGMFVGKKLFAGAFDPIQNVKISRHTFGDLRSVNVFDFPGDAYREITIVQGSRTLKASGIGDIAFWSDALKDFQIEQDVRVTITAARSSTNFSHDTYMTQVTIFDTSMKLAESLLSEKKEKLDVSLSDDGIHVRWYLSSGARVSKELFLTLPDGKVRSIIFDLRYIQEGTNLLKTEGLIDQKIEANEDGLYVVEVNYDNGFAALNTPIIKGNVLPLWINPEDRIIKKDIEHFSASVVQDHSLLEINTLRKGVWAQNLALDPTLNTLAMIKAQDMANNNYVWHVDSKGVRLLGTAKNNNIEISGSIGENVAGGNIHVDVLIAGLIMSGGHRKNMIDTPWKHLGIGYAEKDGKIYYVQVFGE